MRRIASTTCLVSAFAGALGRRRVRVLGVMTACFWLSCQSAMAIDPWPAESWHTASNLTCLGPDSPETNWSGNLSSAFWNPLTRRLWLANNSGVFSVLKENGQGGFTNERNYYVAGTSKEKDLEGITQASDTNRVYLMHERINEIREYMVASGVTNRAWDLTDLVGNVTNDGTEGIAFIQDSWLAASGFCDSNGTVYTKSAYGSNGLGGIMLVGVQHFKKPTTGYVYAVDLNTNGSWTTVGKYKTASRGDSCDLAFDASIGRLYILHNGSDPPAGTPQTNIVEVTDLTSSPYGSDRKFTTLHEFEVPSSNNIEGFAVTPALNNDKTVGDGWCFLTNDDGNGDALRWFRHLTSSISANAGDNQSAPISTALSIPPSVLVQDPFQNPLTNFAVTFAVTSGGGSITEGAATTDTNGIASVGSWTLGANCGGNALSASGSGLDGSPFTFGAAGIDASKTNTLTVNGPAYGKSNPEYGIHTNDAGTSFTVFVTNSPAAAGAGTQYVCIGWAGSGSVPAAGAATNTGRRYLTNDTVITWQWDTNYWIAALTNGRGSVSGACAWIRSGSNVTLHATTNLYSLFAGWSGDIGPPNTSDVAYAVAMDRARTLTANFAECLAAFGTPLHWLADRYPNTNDLAAAELSDTDKDRMRAWEEYVAGTDPTNFLSLLEITGMQAGTNGLNVDWSSVTGRTYAVYLSTNLARGWITEPITGNVPADLSGTTHVRYPATGYPSAFYRITVE